MRPSGHEKRSQPEFEFRLFVSGMTPKSISAVKHIRKLCEKNLRHRYRLEIIDIYKEPEAAAKAEIVAVPALLRDSSKRPLRVVGNLADEARILEWLAGED